VVWEITPASSKRLHEGRHTLAYIYGWAFHARLQVGKVEGAYNVLRTTCGMIS